MEKLQKYFIKNFQLNEKEAETILSFLKIQTLQKGDFFIEEEKICRNAGFLLDGIMRYFTYDNEGNDPTCYFSYPTHYIVDPFTFKEQKPSAINAQAVTRCRMAVISFENDQKLNALFPRWQEITNQIVLQLAMEFSNQKSMLSLSATGRYEYFVQKYPEVAQLAPLQFIASYLGIAQPSLSRIRKKIAGKK